MGLPPVARRQCLESGYRFNFFQKINTEENRVQVVSAKGVAIDLYGDADTMTRQNPYFPFESPTNFAPFRPRAQRLYLQALRIVGQIPWKGESYVLNGAELALLCDWQSDPAKQEKLSPQDFKKHLQELPLADFKNRPTFALQAYLRLVRRYLTSDSGLTFDEYIQREKLAAERLSRKLTLAKDTFLEQGGAVAQAFYKIGTRLLGIERDDYTIRLSYLGNCVLDFPEGNDKPLFSYRNEAGIKTASTADLYFEEFDNYLRIQHRSFWEGMQYGEKTLADLDRIVQIDRTGMLNILNHTQRKRIRPNYNDLLEYGVNVLRRFI